MKKSTLGLFVPPLAALAMLSADAAACGGTFCDSGPTAMPVDQKGENILFVVDGKTVEAHVQIQYRGDPKRFAWVVPVPAVPTVTVGSEQLFVNLMQGTVPRFGFTRQVDTCPCYNCGVAGSGGAASSGGAPNFSADAGVDSGVDVLFQKAVGSFDVTVLRGHSATEVVDWLTANGYQNATAAPAILEKYVARGSAFAAVKLTAGSGSDEIHPLVFKYTGIEPCIPLELTAIAAVEDMGVRAFFLGDQRVASTNYEHVALNPARLDWTANGGNYDDLVTHAVDEAGGHAFVTEYAGGSFVVPSMNPSNSWDSTMFAGIDARDVVDELRRQGLLDCGPFGTNGAAACMAYHPLVLPLLREMLPAPDGVTEGEFYSCVGCVVADAGLAAFDSQAFAAAVQERIFEPARHAAALLARWPYLTRLYTTISPSEMTLDPFFSPRTDLGDVATTSFATWRTTQTFANGFILADGRQVALDDGAMWPVFTDAMPWAARIKRFPDGRPSQTVEDNDDAIDAELAEWNTSRGWPAPPPECPGPLGSGGGGISGGRGGSGGFGSSAGGTSAGTWVPDPTGQNAGGGAGGQGTPAARRTGASEAGGGCNIAGGRARARGPMGAALEAQLGSALAALAAIARRRRRAR